MFWCCSVFRIEARWNSRTDSQPVSAIGPVCPNPGARDAGRSLLHCRRSTQQADEGRQLPEISHGGDVYSLDGKRIWVAGHAGMVGSALVRRLDGAGGEVITIGHADLDLVFFTRASAGAGFVLVSFN